MSVAEQIAALPRMPYVDSEVVEEVVAQDGLDGSTKRVGAEQGLDILRRKNDVWMSFEQWYDGLDEGARKYMDLVLEAALVGLAERTVEGDVTAYDLEARRILAESGGLELTDPQMVGPVSTAVTRTIIKRTIAKNCATKWAGC